MGKSGSPSRVSKLILWERTVRLMSRMDAPDQLKQEIGVEDHLLALAQIRRQGLCF